MNNPQPKNGYLYAATVRKAYVHAAKNSAFSLKECNPNASITLFTTEALVDSECYDIFDNVITKNVPNSRRTKLWALGRTPYDNTMYIDCDTHISHPDISTCFEINNGYDMLFTTVRRYNSNVVGYLDDDYFKYHGGVFLYTKKCIPFMKQWWDLWRRGQEESWKYTLYPVRMREWDQFYLFYLLKHTNHGLSVGIFPEEIRWNYVLGYMKEELQGKDPIITHYTIGRE